MGAADVTSPGDLLQSTVEFGKLFDSTDSFTSVGGIGPMTVDWTLNISSIINDCWRLHAKLLV